MCLWDVISKSIIEYIHIEGTHYLCIFWLQYFDCLPPKYDTWCRHSIRKMISASRRIFWHSFQPSFKKSRFFGSNCYVSLGCYIQKYCFSNQNKLWNMLQAAFDHEKSFFDIPKAWNAAFQWVFKVISLEIWHFSKNVQNQFWPMLKYAVFLRWIRIRYPFCLKPCKM